MNPINRRTFLSGGAAAGILAGFKLPAAMIDDAASPSAPSEKTFNKVVDFRYAPLSFQSTFCFPDDPAKSLVGEHGDLRYDFPHSIFAGINQFGTTVEFTLAGMDRDIWKRQWLENPGTPIVHTLIERPTATLELVTFATRSEAEGRVDNVLMEIRTTAGKINVEPRVRIRSCKNYKLAEKKSVVTEVLQEGSDAPWMYCVPLHNHKGEIRWQQQEGGYDLQLEYGVAAPHEPLRYFFRIPQDGGAGKINTEIDPDRLLDKVRSWWKQWQPFDGKIEWSLQGKYSEFLIACARNIQQARERKNDKLVFEVGPTVYRGLWIADGNFLLEAARYLGYDKQADEGLLTEWQHQSPDGQVAASAGTEDWKDTAIAMFTLARACELKQDWSLMRQLAPNVGQAIGFLITVRDRARKGSSTNGRYGLLAPGFPDGGIGGVHSEFTNTLWTLAGLRAIARANQQLNLPALRNAASFYRELRAAFDSAASHEMVHDPRGFNYLPMLIHDDPDFKADDSWDSPRPQSAQWALSQAIFPGEVFTRNDPVVRGHIALMQACTQEDVPAETGWLRHEAVWNYNAAFVAEVYLWAGLREWAHRTFTGFLNHASPLYAWREEQPLQNALVGEYWGDMPHNWASAECVRYLRHRLILEDGETLRLLAGVLPFDLKMRQPFSIQNTPTRFGRISLLAEPAGLRGWMLRFSRESGMAPVQVEVPHQLTRAAVFARLEGASSKVGLNRQIWIDPAAHEWTAHWMG